jgi:ketosteroid isomerase-like protein
MNPEAELDRLLSYEAIRQLVARYAVAVGARDSEAIAAMFVEDVQLAPGVVGRSALKASYDEMLSGQGASILSTGTHAIDFDDSEHAHGVLYCRAEFESGDEWIVQSIVYHDRYERHDGAWLFRGRKHLLFYGGDILTRPNILPPASKPEIGTGRGSAAKSLADAVARWRPHRTA